jgi:hypothetical protein
MFKRFFFVLLNFKGLTRMTVEDMKDQPMDISLKVPLGEGEIYQIAVSRKPIHSGGKLLLCKWIFFTIVKL